MAHGVLDLDLLFMLVEDCGGVKKVNAKRLWGALAKFFQFPVDHPSPGLVLEKAYSQFLSPFSTFKRKTRTSESHQSALQPVTKKPRFGSDLLLPSGIHRLVASLSSGIRNDMIWAMNELLTLSSSTLFTTIAQTIVPGLKKPAPGRQTITTRAHCMNTLHFSQACTSAKAISKETREHLHPKDREFLIANAPGLLDALLDIIEDEKEYNYIFPSVLASQLMLDEVYASNSEPFKLAAIVVIRNLALVSHNKPLLATPRCISILIRNIFHEKPVSHKQINDRASSTVVLTSDAINYLADHIELSDLSSSLISQLFSYFSVWFATNAQTHVLRALTILPLLSVKPNNIPLIAHFIDTTSLRQITTLVNCTTEQILFSALQTVIAFFRANNPTLILRFLFETRLLSRLFIHISKEGTDSARIISKRASAQIIHRIFDFVKSPFDFVDRCAFSLDQAEKIRKDALDRLFFEIDSLAIAASSDTQIATQVAPILLYFTDYALS